MCVLAAKLALSTHFNLVVAIATINRSTTARFKGYFSVFATLRALYGKHLASGPIAVAIITITTATVPVLPRFPCLAT